MKTLTHQILARAAGRPVTTGEEVWARVDLAVMHDSSGPRRIADTFAAVGGKLWDAEKVVLATDHFTPPANVRHAVILQKAREWARTYRLPHFFDEEGILHNLLLERGFVKPGMLVVGADSHICTVGAHGAMTVGVGSTELAVVLATGEIWLTVPEVVLVYWDGSLPPGTAARDMTMYLLGQLKADFALDRAVEFGGPAISGLNADERAVFTNQGVEMGAVSASILPSEELLAEWAARGIEPVVPLSPVPDESGYEKVYRLNAADVKPLVACPPNVDQVQPAETLGDVKLDRAYIGSCAGGKTADFMLAASVLKGRKVSIPTTAVPATRQVYETCLRNGTLETLAAAGVTIHGPGCGACSGFHSGLLGPGERCISTTTRNFPGRMGDRTAELYLASALTVAASAVAGRITDPRELLEQKGEAAS